MIMRMKKLFFLLIALFGVFVNANSQINIVQTTPQERDPNEYFINGISTREDIGGVDFEFPEIDYTINGGMYGVSTNRGIKSIKLTNYNDFPVTVIVEYNLPGNHDSLKKVRTVTLPPAHNYIYPSKEIDLSYLDANFKQTSYPRVRPEIRSITRKIGGR